MQRQLQPTQYPLRQHSFVFQDVRKIKALFSHCQSKYQLPNHLKILASPREHQSGPVRQNLRDVYLLPVLHLSLLYIKLLIQAMTAMGSILRYHLQIFYVMISLAWTLGSLGHPGVPHLSGQTQRPLAAGAGPPRRAQSGKVWRMNPCQRLRYLYRAGRHPQILEEQASEDCSIYLDSDRTPSLHSCVMGLVILLCQARLFRLDQSLNHSA